MVKLIALYKKPENLEEFERNYFESHLPLASKIPGLLRAEISRISGGPAGDPEYFLMAELYFESLDALNQGMASEAGKAAGKNLRSFAKDIVTMMVGEVEERIPAPVGS